MGNESSNITTSGSQESPVAAPFAMYDTDPSDMGPPNHGSMNPWFYEGYQSNPPYDASAAQNAPGWDTWTADESGSDDGSSYDMAAHHASNVSSLHDTDQLLMYDQGATQNACSMYASDSGSDEGLTKFENAQNASNGWPMYDPDNFLQRDNLPVYESSATNASNGWPMFDSLAYDQGAAQNAMGMDEWTVDESGSSASWNFPSYDTEPRNGSNGWPMYPTNDVFAYNQSPASPPHRGKNKSPYGWPQMSKRPRLH